MARAIANGLRWRMFWPYFFGVSLVLVSLAGPPLVWKWRNASGSRAAFLLSLAPGAFLLTCFGISEVQQAVFVTKMDRIEPGWSTAQVALLLGPPGHIFEPGSLHKGRSYGPTNRSVVWSYTPPREHGLLRITREFPFIRFRSALDELSELLVGGIFGLREGAFILQLGSDSTVVRKGSWD
jgi:hypothetical protein